MKVLLIEDDRSTAALLCEALAAQHYLVDVAEDGQSGLHFATLRNYDLILLDWLVPELDGLSLCRQLRSQGNRTPILLLSPKGTNCDIIQALDAGADDYVIKPYNLAELMARIRALLRRQKVAIAPSVLAWGELHLNSVSAEVVYREQPLSLTPKEYRLLEFFLRHPQRVFSRSAIIDRLWSMDDSPSMGAVTNLIKDLRQKLKAAGISADTIETVYGLGYRLKAPPSGEGEDKGDKEKFPHSPKGLASVNQTIERFRETFAEWMRLLEQVEQALLTGDLSDTLRQQAKQEAHKLAGRLGTFGYPKGSQLAQSIEHLLDSEAAWEASQLSSLAQLFANLQQELAQPSVVPPTTEPLALTQFLHVLVVDDDVVLTERLKGEATAWGMQIETAVNLRTARERITQAPPDVILLDLAFPDSAEDGLTLLQELTAQLPLIPVLALTGRDSLADRVAVSRLGGRGFLHKPVSVEQIFEAIAQVLPATRTADVRVMVVDSDPLMLATLSNLLQPWGLQVTSLQDPAQFWEVLTQTKPELLVLALEMPGFNGIDLCQVVRQDTQWGDLPILMMTARTDTEMIGQVFAAGADDFIHKPVIGPALVTRVMSRIERVRLRQQLEEMRQQEKQVLYRLATVDALTQVANRFRFDEYLNHEWQRLRREQAFLALILCDLDYFKNYNDHYGHQSGDVCLKQIARAIQGVIKRPADLVARYGGEEFAVILPNTNTEGAIHLAEQIQQEVARLHIAHACSATSEYVTMSLGIACTVPTRESTPENLVAAADRALYRAKAQGRNTYWIGTRGEKGRMK